MVTNLNFNLKDRFQKYTSLPEEGFGIIKLLKIDLLPFITDIKLSLHKLILPSVLQGFFCA